MDTRAPQHGLRVWGAATLLLIGCLLIWAGCSEKRDYKTLSFFFDGVPDPNAPVATRPTAWAFNAGGRPQPIILLSVHKPYAEQKCELCHGGLPHGGGERGVPTDAIYNMGSIYQKCTTCHDNLVKEYPRMHGPVVS